MTNLILSTAAIFAYLSLCGPSAPAFAAGNDVGATEQISPQELDVRDFSWSPDGARIALTVTRDGVDTIAVMNRDGSGFDVLLEEPHNNREPVWSRDGGHLYFASDRGDSWDIWRLSLSDRNLTQITDLDGDERAPAASPVAYTFSAAAGDGCGPAFPVDIESYDRIAFTRGAGRQRSVWSIADNGRHLQQVSPEGQICHTPNFSQSGRRLAYVCGRRTNELRDTEARYEQDLAAAVALLDEPACSGINYRDLRGDLDQQPCLSDVERRYTSYRHTPQHRPTAVAHPSYSANEIFIVDANRVFALDSDEALPISLPAGAARTRWSPDGATVASIAPAGGGMAIFAAPADFYMQDATNLWQYPELWRDGESARLQANSFVAVEGEAREFFIRYDEIAYRGRGTYVTVDAALQIVHDVFVATLRDAEESAQDDLEHLSRVLAESYSLTLADDPGARDRWYATYFAVPTVLLSAATDSRNAAISAREAWMEEQGCWNYANCEGLPDVGGGEMIAEHTATYINPLSPHIRENVRSLVDSILGHEGIGTLPFPEEEEALIDFSHFAVRGHYANEGLHGYFMAMMWYALAALPVDAALIDLAARIDVLEVANANGGPRQAIEIWRRLDTMVGSFLGRPVDATISHLNEVLVDPARTVVPPEDAALAVALARTRGEVNVRGLEGATGGERGVRFTFMPQRLGSDVEVIRQLTHPDLPERYDPSALDIFAAAGVDRAAQHAVAALTDQAMAEAYLTALDNTALAPAQAHMPTDIYHVWLSALISVANSVGGVKSSAT